MQLRKATLNDYNQMSSQQIPNLNIDFQNIILLHEWNENEWKERKKPTKQTQNILQVKKSE